MIKFLRKIVNKIIHGIINLGRKTLNFIFKLKKKGEETIDDFEKLQRGEEIDMSKYSASENDKALKEFETERHKIDSNDPELTREEIDDMFDTLKNDKVINIVEPEFEIHLDSTDGSKDYNVKAIEEIFNHGLFYTKDVMFKDENETDEEEVENVQH